MLLITLATFVVGLALLAFGGDRFVLGSEAIAKNLRLPPIVIGLTIAGFATSAPEMLISAVASAGGNPSLALGNAVGSNIANIGLVLGVAALIQPLTLHSAATRQQLLALFLVTILAVPLFFDGFLSRNDGYILLASLCPLTALLVVLSLRSKQPDSTTAIATSSSVDMGTPKAVMWLIIGLTLMLFGADRVVTSAEFFAREIGISDLVIGLTIVAVGTSLPELAVAITGVLKRKYDLVIGNIIGSNIFNLLAVIGIAGAIEPHELDGRVLELDYPVMAGFTLVLFMLAYNQRKKQVIGRLVGGILLSAFFVYHGSMAWNIFST
ncbi:MAG: calcium/sodium antiporter [Pseudomonadota bacterium]|nr:calcium/sodium antiporter [Pseudomonadota bacterium]